jgi:integrase
MRGSTSSTIDPAGVRPYFGGPFEAIAAARSNRTPRTSARHCSNNWVQASSSGLAGRVALQEGHVVRNVAELVDRIPADPKPADTFTPAELQQVLDHIDGDRYAVAWQLALTGLRRGEVAGLVGVTSIWTHGLCRSPRRGCGSVGARMLKAARVRDIRYHDARHTCGTLMHLQDVPIAVISAWLGHASKASRCRRTCTRNRTH